MNTENKYALENIKKITLKLFPISIFFYVSLTTYFPRNCYKFVKTKTLDNKFHPEITRLENSSKIKLRKKLLTDLKIHSTSINWNKKNATKIIVNLEGKIIGYKFCNIFYPNYFTKIQNNKLLFKRKILKPSIKIFLVIFKNN